MLDFFSGGYFAGDGWAHHDPSDDYWYQPRGIDTSAGIAVTEGNAPEMPAVWACVGKNAKTLASLPVHVYEKTGPRTRRMVDHPLNDILTWGGAQRGTGLTARAARVANRLLWGNAVSEVVYANDGRTVREIVPLQSQYLRPKFDSATGDLLWEHWPEGQYDTTLTPDKYLHEPGHFSLDGVMGISAVKYCREAIAAGRAAEIFGATFFGNGATPGGFLEFPRDIGLSDERQDQLVEKFNETWQGAKRAHKIGRLREGVKFTQVGMPLEDMQFLELRKFDRIQICMIFDTPPVMIQELDPGKYTAIEQAMIAWVRDSLLPQVTATEAVFKRKFFADTNLYLKFNLAGLARGDMAARAEFYREGINWGWFTQNDVREMEDLDPVEGGDTNWIGMNMMPITMGGAMVQQKVQQQNGGGGQQEDQDGEDEDTEGRSRRPSPPVIVVPVNVIQSRETPETPAIDVEAIGRQVAESILTAQRQTAAAMLAEHDAREAERIAVLLAQTEALGTQITEASAGLSDEITAVKDSVEETVEQQSEKVCVSVNAAVISINEHNGKLECVQSVLDNISEQLQGANTETIHNAFRPILEEMCSRIVAKETKAVQDALKRYADDEEPNRYLGWCDKFFTGHIECVKTAIKPIVCGIELATKVLAEERPEEFAARYVQHQLRIARSIPSGGTDLDPGYLLAVLKATYLTLEKSHAA